MDVDALARFTPVAFGVGPQPWVDWGELGEVRFDEPFFDQTIERWARGTPPPRLVRTDLATLEPLDETPSLDPCALIFHLSRCGSTLVSRLLATSPSALVIAEPAPLNTLLMADSNQLGVERHVQLLRRLVRALGRCRFDARHYVLKLSSWNITRLALFRRAFPRAAVIWLQRSPVEVMASLLADPPGWMGLREHPRRAQALFGIGAESRTALGAEEFCAQALATMLLSACDADDGSALLLDYEELPDAIWRRVAPFAGMSVGEQEIERMREQARFHAKDPGQRPFTSDSAAKRRASPQVSALAARHLESLYRALDQRRRAALDGEPLPADHRAP